MTRYWKSYEGQSEDQASTRSWRNNNPGNLLIGEFARLNGAIGDAGHIRKRPDLKFAVFPDYITGRNAQAKRLKEGDMYIDLTLNELPRKYTGVEKGKPDTEEVIRYRKSIKDFSKLDMGRTIRSLNDKEFEQLLDAMKRHEGWREGREVPKDVKKIHGVRLDKKRTISEYLVGNKEVKEWISKKDAIVLAEAGMLYATVVHVKNKKYLRPKYHQTSFRQMVC